MTSSDDSARGRASSAASKASDAAGRAGASARGAAGKAQSAAGKAQSAAAGAEQHPAARWALSAGQVANGVVHLIIGGIALGVAFGGGGSADQSGAMQALQESPFGAFALWAVGIALAALALYSIVGAISDSRHDTKDALKSAGRAVAYAAVSATAITAALGGSSDGEQSAQSFSGDLMAQPFGRILVGAIGLGIAAVGAYFVVKGVQRKFREDVAPPQRWSTAVKGLGTGGYVAKGAAVIIVGVLFVIAAVLHDEEQAGGLDGALQSLTTVPGGVVALIAIALGLMLYGVYCFARAAWPRMR
ncbi:DUF1206 domain-containing protein [Agrococcus sp. 1P02AA]|uniref:DUF1206 domain-containing protein n=1 Tax=Agrococcus sp. 1P02AA TaxID=3132259 RepID=UPI0039A42DA9